MDREERVAIKIHDPEKWAGRLETLTREHSVLAQVAHPALPRAAGMGRVAETGELAFVMELARGRDLWHAIPAGKRPSQLVRLGMEVLRAARALHARGIRHNDLHPGNVLYDEQTGSVTVIDVGNATSIDDDSKIANQRYGPPEQNRGSRVSMAGGVGSDIYHVGGLIAHLVTGLHPDRADPDAIMRRVPDFRAMVDGREVRLVDVLRRACALDPSHRYQSAQAFLNALRPFSSQ